MASIVESISKFKGDIQLINNVAYSFPASQGAAASVFTNDGSGNITWAAASGAVGTVPGGRLSLTTGVPGSLSVVTGATSIYYTPYLNNAIRMWDGASWTEITFTEYTFALGTLTSAKIYDLFAYNNSGALAIEALVWTSGSARATAVTLQDGRYCKSGDKTRLYLGSFYTTSTTTTEVSLTNVYLWNMYNRVIRPAYVVEPTDWTQGQAGPTEWNSATAERINFIVGLVEDAVVQEAIVFGYYNTPTSIAVSASGGLNGVAVAPVNFSLITATSTAYYLSLPYARTHTPALGFNHLDVFCTEFSGAQTFNWIDCQQSTAIRG